MNQIDIKSNEYPSSLRQIPDPPGILYYKGDWNPELFEKTISVVGARRMTRYGETMTDRLVTDLASSGITIVSGFMYGIDARAHESAVNAPGKTIAVMPCGINRIHPEYQEDLYHKILGTGGLILSEYEGDMPPALWTYPRRNRIVAALSPVLLVMEAALKSGALITARLAEKFNKRIYALPGPLTSEVSLGTARLIQRGASILTGVQEILTEYGLDSVKAVSSRQNGMSGLSTLQKQIIQHLSREPLTADELIRKMGKPSSRIGAELTLLSLRKLLRLQEGRYFLISQGSCGGYVCL